MYNEEGKRAKGCRYTEAMQDYASETRTPDDTKVRHAERQGNKWPVRHVRSNGHFTTTTQSSLLTPPEQALQRRLELAPVRITRLFQTHAIISTPLLLNLLLLLGLAAFALAVLSLLLLVDDEHARGAGLEAGALGDAGVPKACCSHRFVCRLSFVRTFGVW
jgi:hypothetical protein